MQTPAPTRATSSMSIIGPDLVISGNLVTKGEVRIDGEIQGDTYATQIVVNEKARVTGAVIGEKVVVHGQVMGSVRGKRVMLQATSHVEGDVYHATLVVDRGAFLEGKSRRIEDPMGAMPRPDFARP